LLKILPLLPVEKCLLFYIFELRLQFINVFSLLFILGLEISDFLFELLLGFTKGVMTFKLHLFKLLKELFLFGVLRAGLLLKVLDLLQVEGLLFVELTL